MTKIRPNLFLGHRYDAHMDCVKYGITAILNVADNQNDPDYEAFKVRTVKVGLSDDANNPGHMIELAVKALDHLIENGHTVLVHCIAGASRSPHIVALHLSRKEGRSYDDIYGELKALRKEVRDHGRSKLNPK